MKYLFPALIVFLSLAVTSCDRAPPLGFRNCAPYCSNENPPELTLKAEQYLRENETEAYIRIAEVLYNNFRLIAPIDETKALSWALKINKVTDVSHWEERWISDYYNGNKNYKKALVFALKYMKSSQG